MALEVMKIFVIKQQFFYIYIRSFSTKFNL